MCCIRIGANPILNNIIDAIFVGVRHERIGFKYDFRSILQSVSVRIGNMRISTDGNLVSVEEAIAISIRIERVCIMNGYFGSVGQSVTVRIGLSRISKSPNGIFDRQAIGRKARINRPRKVVEILILPWRRHPSALYASHHLNVSEGIGGAQVADINGIRFRMWKYQLACNEFICVVVIL